MRQPKFIKVIERIFLLSCIVGLSVVLFAQSAKPADWLMDGGDIERTGWQKDEKLLSTTTVKNKKMLWGKEATSQSLLQIKVKRRPRFV